MARVLYGSSEREADLRYAVRMVIPDPFFWAEKGGRTYAVLGPLEIDRARRTARVDELIPAEELVPEEGKRSDPVELLLALAQRLRFRVAEVPETFPLGVADRAGKQGLRFRVRQGPFFPERQRKSEEEIGWITEALRTAEAGMERAREILRESRPDAKRRLRWKEEELTSERLRGEIEAVIARRGGIAEQSIVAGGLQACDPHEQGSGPLHAGEAIVIDLFPRSRASGYYGDLSRTFVKGEPSEALQRLYDTVAAGKRWVLETMREGTDGRALHRHLLRRFAQAGYPTERRGGRWVGFFHGTGHSLGLEIHEPPRFAAGRFQAGQVMTVEPGLYYPEIGGVRLEDLVVVERGAIRNLTRSPEEFKIP
ncbi:M24 family metallopeptidase [Methylacidimicrobium tartarophylax]|uniref:Xaa-Pro aminopeptidase n=1 Tax=Methylacidimicrobium tartarophylax TaxID=1041768 RepID=A0A5E6M4A9_9BACT|nr:M24 family metallopeptidase [Methylacidimicrobium tartarophylax]VVM04408.1 Xaa-Pro aminopeptidase [Methylacidimicrobium tartarophylax]